MKTFEFAWNLHLHRTKRDKTSCHHPVQSAWPDFCEPKVWWLVSGCPLGGLGGREGVQKTVPLKTIATLDHELYGMTFLLSCRPSPNSAFFRVDLQNSWISQSWASDSTNVASWRKEVYSVQKSWALRKTTMHESNWIFATSLSIRAAFANIFSSLQIPTCWYTFELPYSSPSWIVVETIT